MFFRFCTSARPTIAGAVLFALLVLLAPPATAERVHVVARGHTLGKISKRYHVPIKELCEANNIRRRDPLKVGQRIVIPDDDDDDDAKEKKESRSPPPKRPSKSDKNKDSGDYTTHKVARGHTLGKIARRFLTSVDAIRSANDLRRGQPLRVGQCLIVPLTRRSTDRQRARRLPCLPEGLDYRSIKPGRRPPNPYARRPKHPGVVRIVRRGRTFRGRLLRGNGRPIPSAVEKLDALLFDRRTSDTHTTHPDLLQKIVAVSNHFGGRRLIVVSGYRAESSNPYTSRSKHSSGQAIDFRIEAVPNEALRDYCHTLSGVGVGYYPNSSFIHLDVRRVTTHWTDVSGPGEAPQYTSVRAPKK